jgi:hypothetical protein
MMLIAVALGLMFGGCAEQPLMTDDEYYATHGPAANSPDAMSHIPAPAASGLPGGR